MASSLPASLQLSVLPSERAEQALHLLPFQIQYSGPANVKAYFDPQEVTSSYTGEDGAYKAYFRGRALLGTRIALPAGYVGQVWKSNGPSISRVAADERRKRERVAVAATAGEGPVYSQDGLRRSPRKHGAPAEAQSQGAAKKQKLAKKKKKLVKREMFDLDDDGDADQQDGAPVDLAQVPVTGMNEASTSQIKLEDPPMLDAPLALEEAKHELEVIESTDATKEEEAAQKQGPVECIAKAQPIASGSSPVQPPTVHKSTPPPSSSASPSSIPATPSTPHASSDFLPIINNIVTPKPFSRSAVDGDEPDLEAQEAITERILQNIAGFKEVTVWNPDIALDRGEDVYVRAMDEWTKLAEFVRV